MNNLDVDIKIVKSWPKEEIVELYKSGGWWKDSYDSSELQHLIKGSFVFAVLVEKNSKKAIGMGRILSDGVSDAYLQDIVIHSDYRGNGFGKKLIDFLIDYCKSKKISWIALIAEPNQDSFYRSIGFKHMKNYVPMKYEMEE